MERLGHRFILHTALVGLFGIAAASIPHPETRTPLSGYPASETPQHWLLMEGYLPYHTILETKITPLPTPTPTPAVPAKFKLYSVNPSVWEGKATVYSRAGCLGCRDDRKMANGEYLDDDVLTIAFMRIPLNSKVLVENLDTGLSVVARVTDRGGFEVWNRIADVSPAVKYQIGLLTDISQIRITWIE